MNILLTGGSGFLGKKLGVALMQAGHRVHNLDVKPCALFPTTQVDILDQFSILPYFHEVDAVFHLASYIEAGESVEKPEKYIKNNILGTLSVLEAMRRSGVKKFLFSSSAAVYGEPIRVPIKEDDRTIPINPYGMTKLAMEGLVSSYVASYGMTGVALRYFNLYGPGEDHEPETHAIPRFISQIMQDKEVTVWGEGLNLRDYIYIDDVVRAHLLALELQDGYQYMNLSGQRSTSVIDVIHLLEKILGKQANIRFFPPRPGDPMELYADSSKAGKVLGWQAEVGIEEGLRKTVDWFMRVK